MLGSITDSILRLPGWVALMVIFLAPALESSVFLGFVVPGEIAVLLGGVLAHEGVIPLGAAIAAAVLGAIIGDSIGYMVGRRWGRRMLHGTLGRLPIIKRRLDEHLDDAEAFVRRRKGSSVFLGRFTTILRVLVPGLAGMAEMHYLTFLAYNVAGGAIWGTGFVLLGYFGAASYHRVETFASGAGLVLLAVIVVGWAASRLVRRLRVGRHDRLKGKRRCSLKTSIPHPSPFSNGAAPDASATGGVCRPERSSGRRFCSPWSPSQEFRGLGLGRHEERCEDHPSLPVRDQHLPRRRREEVSSSWMTRRSPKLRVRAKSTNEPIETAR